MKRFTFESHDDGTVTLTVAFDPEALGGLYVHGPALRAIGEKAVDSPAFVKYVRAQILDTFERIDLAARVGVVPP